jgi:Ca-activated chloride channel family protein
MRLLEQGDAGAASREFKDPDWSAAASYRAGDYESALKHYRQSNDAQAWYNRGNSLAKNGDLPAAIEAYAEALKQQPAMEDAAFNKQLVEQLQQQQEEQQEQDQQNQDQQNQDQQDQDQQDQDQQNQDQQDRDQQDQDQQDRDQQDQDREQREQEQQNRQQQAEQTKSQEETERELANEQWLRRIPDDPAGLLRRKFRYESQQRSEKRRDSNENSW